MTTLKSWKRAAVALLLPAIAVGVAFGASGSLGGSTPKTEAANPVVVRALAPDIYDYFIDGDNTRAAPPLAVNPTNGLNVGEILAGDQSATLGGNLDLYPDPTESNLMEAFGASDSPPGPAQINNVAGSVAQLAVPDLSGSLAIAGYLPGKECSGAGACATSISAPASWTSEVGRVTFSASVGGVYAESFGAASAPHGLGPVDPTGATTVCGSLPSYAAGGDPVTGAGKADFPDGDCDGIRQGPVDYSGAVLGPVSPGACGAWYSGGLVGPAPNDPTCREDGLVMAHLLVTPAAALGLGTATFTQAAAPTAGIVSGSAPATGGVGTAGYDVHGPAVAVAPIKNPDCAGTLPGCVADPLTVGGGSPNCGINLDSGSAILTWDGIAPSQPTLAEALYTPLDALGAPVSRDHMTWSSSNTSIVGVQEPLGTSFNIPAALPVPLAGIVGADLLCSDGSPGTANVTVTGSFSTTFPVTVADVTSLKLDMDPTNGTGPCAPVDAAIAVSTAQIFQVAVCLNNPSGSVPVAAFKYDILYNDTIILAPEVADVGSGLDDNPDANTGTTTFSSPNLGGGWDCTGGVGAYPKGDVDGIVNGTGDAFSGGCGSAAGPNTLISGPLGEITFQATNAGSVSLTISNASVTDNDLNEIGSCNPSVDAPMLCVGGSATVSSPTPTNTATATNTPLPATSTFTATATNTATATPAGPTVNKVPNISNLFLCEVGPCAGPGEGDVVLHEIANNVTVPMGGFEIQVKFDHKIFNVLWTPNTALFTLNGRTPTCNLQIVTENWILFGCVSTGPVGSGATGSGLDLGTITLTPNADMRFRLHPGNDNGVVRMILDENCEIADTLGHPLPGSINGGLTLECGDAAITVRILEGDLNLDCTVDIIDEQAIAQRYGTFFGNIFYDPWYDLEPALKDFDVDIKDVQKVFGRDGSTCQNPIQPQPPVAGLSVGPL